MIMSTLTFSEVEIAAHFVHVGWVARHYNISRTSVYRALREGRLPFIKTRDGVVLIDTRELPDKIGR